MAGDELLARIEKHPDDDSAYLVYADFLTSKGDPQGELIVLMHQLREAKTDEQRAYLGNALDAYQAKHRKMLFGPLGQHTGIGWDFHLGFLRGARVCPDTRDQSSELVKQICALPIARFMRELVVFDRWEQKRGAIQKAVDANKPTTLERFEIAKQYESLESALENVEHAKWLALTVDSERPPAELARLVNLEWLELGGDFQVVPASLTKLTKLRRLDIDWCGNLDTFDEEVWGIESLSYISMYDCGLPKAYHMGRVNSLLFGFSRARTSARRRVIEANLLLGNEARANKLASRADLLAALDNNVGAVRDAALRLLAGRLGDPFAKGVPAKASFALAGKTNIDKKQIAAKLAERGHTLAQKIDDTTTHVILGVEPGGKQAAIGELPVVLDAHLQKLFAGKAAAKGKKRDLDDVREGLRSGDEKQTAAAVAAITEGDFDASLLLELVLVVQDTTLGKSRDAAKKLIALHAPVVDAAVKAHLKSSVLNTSMGETKRTDRLAAFAKQSKLDAMDFAMLLLRRAKLGLAYVIANGTSAQITQALEILVEHGGGTKLDLSHRELSVVPDEVAKLSKVEELNLRGNHFTKFPEHVLAMKSLVKLNVSHNRIAKIPDAIAKTKLVELDIRSCRWRKFPAAVLGIATLETLEMSNSRDYTENEARITGIPAEIGRLTKLKRFGYGFNILTGGSPDALWKLPLEALDLGFCDLPDELPAELASLKKLKLLRVVYTGWKAKKAALKKLLPKCEIEA
jgi:uncharacterized protein (TIGR02996 family)